MGAVSTTVSGNTCQQWGEQFPHNHTYTDPRFFPENDLDLTSNYCRNPNADSDGPWCFTTDPDIRIEYCKIPKCPLYPECKWTVEGTEYRGSLAETQGGESCIPWSDIGVDLEANYCRNPETYSGGPWCYYGEEEEDWDYCDVPDCQTTITCKETESGESYMGTRSISRSDKPCQRWDSQSPHSHDFTDPDMFPDDDLEAASSYCRNPGGARAGGPWCFTRDPEVPWQYCDIPHCEASDPKECIRPESPVKHVLHIGLDGLHANCFLDAESGAQNIMERLAYKGSYTLENARAELQTVSGPNWASHVCGMNIETTGVTGNGWAAPWMGNPQPITPITTDRVPLPCGFMYLKGMDDNIRTASFMNWRWIYWMGNRGAPGSMDVDMSCADMLIGGALCDSYVVGNASEYIRNIKGAADRSYTFLHLDLLDVRGHTYSWCNLLYLQGVDMVDAWIGELLDAIDDDDGEEWLVLLSSDHGGSDNSHGDWKDSDIMIPFFVRGPGVKKNYTLNAQVSNGDIIPTAAWALELDGSNWWTGHVVKDAFKMFDSPEEELYMD